MSKKLWSNLFSEQEIEEALKSMKEDYAPGPNGFTSTFFKVFWEYVKGDIFEMLEGSWILKEIIMVL